MCMLKPKNYNGAQTGGCSRLSVTQCTRQDTYWLSLPNFLLEVRRYIHIESIQKGEMWPKRKDGLLAILCYNHIAMAHLRFSS